MGKTLTSTSAGAHRCFAAIEGLSRTVAILSVTRRRPPTHEFSCIHFVLNDACHPVHVQVLACCSALSFHFALGLVLAYSAVLLPQLEAPDSDLKIAKDQASLVGESAAQRRCQLYGLMQMERATLQK